MSKVKAALKKKADIPEEFQHLELSRVKPSKFNYRKHYRNGYMAELTESVKEKGVLEPICVRPTGKDYEVVFGNCRREASIKAGLKKIPSIIKNLTDEEALEAQIIENSHREDPNPMDEAAGFKSLIAMGKHTPETLAKKLDKSLSYVFSRLSMAKLPDEVQNAVLSEKISLGHALILTRLRHPGEQKEMMKAIISEGMSVREAAHSLGNFTHDISNAVFNTESCNKCPFLSRNQTVLFPELKKTGECMDKGCFFAKTRDHYKAILDTRKKEGFKVITDKKEAEGLCSWNSKTSKSICPPGGKFSHDVPKKYKSECMKCIQSHAFFLYEEDSYRGKNFKFGEICLDRKCFEKMNRTGRETEDAEKNSDSGNGRMSPCTLAAHATACRDRFLRAALPERVEDSEILRKRLLIYHILESLVESGDCQEIYKIFEGYSSKKAIRSFGWVTETGYDAIAAIKATDIDAVIHGLLVSGLGHMKPTVLLRMTPEAGIDMTKDFGPDEEFLNSKTKDELVKFTSTHRLAVEVKESEKKGNIVKAILTQDLKGKLTEELKEAVEIAEG